VREALGHVLIILRVTLGDVGAGQDDLCTHRLQVEDLLATHLVGHDEDQAVALLLGDQGEADAGIARGAFDERIAGLDLACAFGGSRGPRRADDAMAALMTACA